ncbi:HlyD family secretion protein [Bradyrhizobium sp. CB3481]|uniref:HlyD family secretion protein n=1 Tax=Bradyrhizobium sp. CB3481 TaxID=3039158 RepID=UPI0024B1988A|nr:HlyD family secretion protein [Bradyrhizobium sp. CB3481]WFU18094.1 HlyD family secretion protein [Bradyrhizobium sp. CB3481]
MDTRTIERSPSPDRPRLLPTRSEQQPQPKDHQANSGAQDKAQPPASLRDRLRAHWLLASVVTCLLLVAVSGGTIYWLSIRNYEITDDAFIAARSFSVAPKVGGYVTDVPVTDNQHVNAGDLLARIDDRDYVIAVSQAKAQVAVAEANIDNVQAQIESQHQQIDQAKAQLEQAEAQLKFADQEEARAKDLVDKGAGTVQREQQTRSDLQSQQANTSRAKAAMIAAELGIKTLGAQLESARAGRQQAQAQLDQANLNLQYTRITADQAGRVVKLSGAVGTLATAGQALMMLVPDDIWIVANYKETQLRYMRPGQPVEFTIDAYAGRTLTGRVASIQPGSGTAFSLLPAENATGNFVKVVQRVPVKIVVDHWPADVPVGPGMSVVPWTRVIGPK